MTKAFGWKKTQFFNASKGIKEETFYLFFVPVICRFDNESPQAHGNR